MNKSLLTLGIVLSLGTVGCAGFGVQQGSSRTAHAQTEPGLDHLWVAREEAPTQGLEAGPYAEQGLDGLWEAREVPLASGSGTRSFADQSLGSLWTSSF
jgi:hypothetical protein